MYYPWKYDFPLPRLVLYCFIFLLNLFHISPNLFIFLLNLFHISTKYVILVNPIFLSLVSICIVSYFYFSQKVSFYEYI